MTAAELYERGERRRLTDSGNKSLTVKSDDVMTDARSAAAAAAAAAVSVFHHSVYERREEF